VTTFAIVGAGPGLGLAAAKRFGREGFAVALIARRQGRVDELAGDLRREGYLAQGFEADARDRASLRAALGLAEQRLGPVEVLQYSPIPAKEFMRPVLETAADDLVGPVEMSIYGPVTAAHQVIPGMLAGRGRTLSGHQNQRPSSAAIDGVMNERTISVSNSRPRAIVVPI
jgi:NADP-dependent 3-hydroxy acid dehydrogenase YdfG